MITIISGTNRKGSLTKAFAEKYYHIISELSDKAVHFVALEDIEHDWFSSEMYDGAKLPSGFVSLQEKNIIAAEAFVVFSPEYNGGFPGALKMFIDACSVNRYKENFHNKKAGFVGVADGRAGNLRGMGQLAAIFNHLGTTTFPNQLPISSASKLLNENGEVTDKSTLESMTAHASTFLAYINA